MERPALQALMQRIQDGRVDVVVVYKVDRLTRSLADFAKLVEIFDTHKVSIVSVTQSFNTTSSMGRLTLNVLLSFAQFEREVTGERIRDKIAASKRKGLWMGGTVPHGYRVQDRKLIIVEQEAAEVRLIFERYLALASLRALQRELRDRRINTRARLLSNERTIGGIAFTTGPLAYLLSNRLYTGTITHLNQNYTGEHQAIITNEIFDRVQLQLALQSQSKRSHHLRSLAILKGRLFNSAGEKMSPTYTAKSGLHYRYYISVSAMQSQQKNQAAVHRVNALSIEQIIFDHLDSYEKDRQVHHITEDHLLPEDSNATALIRHSSIHSTAEALASAKALIERLLDRVILHSDKIDLYLFGPEEAQTNLTHLIIPWQQASQKRQCEIHVPEGDRNGARPLDPIEQKRLVRAIAKAHHWLEEIINGQVSSLNAIAKRERRSQRSISMTLSLAFLGPALIMAAIEGRLPRGYGVTKLSDLPARFEDQWIALGLPHTGARSFV